MSQLLHLLMYEIRLTALAFLVVVYLFKIGWILRYPARPERTMPAGSKRAGILWSLANIALPWRMESTRRQPFFYAQFVIFHLGVAAVLAISFIIPFWPWMLEPAGVIECFQVLMGGAALIGVGRMLRRLRTPALRLISTADDLTSLFFMILYLALGVWAAPNEPLRSEVPLLAFFAATTVFEIYAPFSKIGHYLFYPFTRTLLGRTLGHRGVVAAAREEWL